MKKRILLFGILISACCLTAFSFMNRNQANMNLETTSSNATPPVNFYPSFELNNDTELNVQFDVGSRYMMTVPRDELQTAESIVDILPERFPDAMSVFESVEIIILENDRQYQLLAAGPTDLLSDYQINLLHSVDYGTNILARDHHPNSIEWSGERNEYIHTPHFTIVPEKQAEYRDGKHVLIHYLRENSKTFTSHVKESGLQPGKIYFTVTQAGDISEVHLTASSNYDRLDQGMVELISKLPGEWLPAENARGEKIDQQLVLSFGSIGC